MVLENSHEEWLLRLYNNEQRQTFEQWLKYIQDTWAMVKKYIQGTRYSEIKLTISIIYLHIYKVWIKLLKLIQVKIWIKLVEFNNINHKYSNHIYKNMN